MRLPLSLLCILLHAAPAHANDLVGREVTLRSGQKDHSLHLHRRSGRGHSGEVFIGTSNGTPAAIKLARPERNAAAIAAEFRHELTVSQHIGPLHPAIVHLYRYGEVRVDGRARAALVMEPIRGEPLGSARGATRVRSPEVALRILAKLVEVAASLEHGGFRHNDWHPENILLEGDDPATLRVIDVARASPLSQPATATRITFGAPERRAEQRPVGVRSDIYSVGGVLYAMLSGEPPPLNKGERGRHFGVREDQVARVVDALPNTSIGQREALRVLLRGCLRSKPGNRFASFDEVAAAIATARTAL